MLCFERFIKLVGNRMHISREHIIQEMLPEATRELHELFEKRPFIFDKLEEYRHGHLSRVLDSRLDLSL